MNGAPHRIRVFEHQQLRVGDVVEGVLFTSQHLDALQAFAKRHFTPYFSLIPEGVRFAQYVGALQVGNLTIEILPKTDADSQTMQAVLLDMLRLCQMLPRQPAPADLHAQQLTLPELFVGQWLESLEQLLLRGLVQGYQRKEAARLSLKGQLRWSQQLRNQARGLPQFITIAEERTTVHRYNQILYAALNRLQALPLSPAKSYKMQHLLFQWPPPPPIKQLPNANQLHFDRHTQHYKQPVQDALLLLQQLQPGVRGGAHPALAMLFDMNRLFETYIFRQLQQAAPEGVNRHPNRLFWQDRYLRPDLLLQLPNGQRIVLDIKWKHLQRLAPDMHDLRQLFAYHQYFDATHSALVYPRAAGLSDPDPVSFYPVPGSSNVYTMQILFADIVKNGALNKALGQELLERLLLHSF